MLGAAAVNPPSLAVGKVTRDFGAGGVEIEIGAEVVSARVGFGCIVRPIAGDRVLATRSLEGVFVLAVLERLVPDRATITADGDDLSFVTVRVEDKDGNFCPTADNLVKFALDGPAKIAGVDNGNAATVEPFQADYRKAFNGLALLIVRSKRGKAGHVKITATSEGLRAGETTVTTK